MLIKVPQGQDIEYGALRKHEGMIAAGEGDMARRVASWHRARLMGN